MYSVPARSPPGPDEAGHHGGDPPGMGPAHDRQPTAVLPQSDGQIQDGHPAGDATTPTNTRALSQSTHTSWLLRRMHARAKSDVAGQRAATSAPGSISQARAGGVVNSRSLPSAAPIPSERPSVSLARAKLTEGLVYRHG